MSSRYCINDLLRVRYNAQTGFEEDESPLPQSEEWVAPDISEIQDGYHGATLNQLLRKADIDNPKYDWRKTTKKGRFSHKNFGVYLFDIL